MGNEACPRWINEKLALSIWVDYDNPINREIDDMSKFVVTDENDNLVMETDDEAKLLEFITKYALLKIADSVIADLQKILTCGYESTVSYTEAAIDEVESIKATLK